MTTHNEHDRSVEDVWRDILARNGVSEAQADDIVTLTFATPALTRDIPDIEDVPDIVRDALTDTDLQEYLDDDENPDLVEDKLVWALEDALSGKLSGPASVSEATLSQPFTPSREPPETETPDGPDGTAAQPDRAPAYQSAAAARAAESTRSDEEIERIANTLEGLMDDYDLETTDLYAALERIEEDATE